MVFKHHVDTSQLERLWRVNSLDVNNRSCCVLRDVCVDKLVALPILCVQQLVSPLFCMNASQSAIISLWRYVPV